MKEKKFRIRKFIILILSIVAVVSLVLLLAIFTKKDNNKIEENPLVSVDLSNEIVYELFNVFTKEELAYLYDFTDLKVEKIELKDLSNELKNYISYSSLSDILDDECSNYVDSIPEEWYCSNLYNKNGNTTKIIVDDTLKNISFKYFNDYSVNEFNVSKGSKFVSIDNKYVLISTKYYDEMGVMYFYEFKDAKMNSNELIINVRVVDMKDGKEYIYTYDFIKNDKNNYVFNYLDKKVKVD